MHNEDDEFFEENELTESDLELLRAFESREVWPTSIDTTQNLATRPLPPLDSDPDGPADEMFELFRTETSEDFNRLQHAVQLLFQEKEVHRTRFKTIQRASHKLRGTCGALGYMGTSTIAGHIEIISEQVEHAMITPEAGLNAIDQAATILSFFFDQIFSTRKEPDEPSIIPDLETLYQLHAIDLSQPIPEIEKPLPQKEVQSSSHTITSLSPTTDQPALDAEEDLLSQTLHSPGGLVLGTGHNTHFFQSATQRFQNLIQHTEQLIDYNAAISNAQSQIEKTLQDLQAAHERVRHYEWLLSNYLLGDRSIRLLEEKTSSSLIARILRNAALDPKHNKHLHRSQSRAYISGQKNGEWDRLDMEHYSEQDKLLSTLREAILNVDICTSQLSNSYNHLRTLQQAYTQRAIQIRSDTALIRLAPLSILFSGLREIIEKLPAGQFYFDVVGEKIEVDLNILEVLTKPLKLILSNCVKDIAANSQSPTQAQPHHGWLHAQSVGNNVTINLGFSFTIDTNEIGSISELLKKLNGNVFLQPNSVDGITITLRFPRSNSIDRCLLVRCGDQRYMIPLSQIQRVTDTANMPTDILYRLSDLLGLQTLSQQPPFQPLIILHTETTNRTIAIAIDELIEEIELLAHPLKPYLQRAGIAGAAIDGQNNVLLMLDLPELVHHYHQQTNKHDPLEKPVADEQKSSPTRRQPKILIADDSASIRQSILLSLEHTHYQVQEARDGVEALEILTTATPDIFLLDIEMPRLNGYDLLNIMRLYPEFSHIKIIMLTSRSSDKHMQRAIELGAHAYLTKPTPQEILLATINRLLAQSVIKP